MVDSSSSRPHGSDGTAPAPAIMQRLLARVQDAQLAEDTRAGALARRARRRRLERRSPASAEQRSPEQQREARVLRRVFLDLGDCYRDYRRRTGASVSPDVRNAADRFRLQRDLPSLALVAASLDRLESLRW